MKNKVRLIVSISILIIALAAGVFFLITNKFKANTLNLVSSFSEFDHHHDLTTVIPNITIEKVAAIINYAPTPPSNLPTSFDWRNRHGENWLTPAKKQGSAGTCWAHAEVGAFESAINLYYNQHIDVDLSEQMLVDCKDGATGDLKKQYDYYNPGYYNLRSPMLVNGSMIVSDGIPDEACDKYVGRDTWGNVGVPENACNFTNVCTDWQQRLWKLPNGFKNILTYNPYDDTAEIYDSTTLDNDRVITVKDLNTIKLALIQKGPLEAGLGHAAHAMVLVGYLSPANGTEFINPGHFSDITDYAIKGKTYFIFKDSEGIIGEGDGTIYYEFNSIKDISSVTAISGPFTPPAGKIYSVACVDKDGDGYYNWGLGSKPATCPANTPDIEDCDDSNKAIARYDESYNCGPASASGVVKYTINSTPTPFGAISPAGASSIDKGGSIKYAITASPGYKISSVTVDDKSVGMVSNYEFTNVITNHTITATFSILNEPAVSATSPVVTTDNASVSDASVTLTGTVSSNGTVAGGTVATIGQKGVWYWPTNSGPVIILNDASIGTGINRNIISLLAGNYSYRAFANNSAGLQSQGVVKTFTITSTSTSKPLVPTVTTSAVTDTTPSSAVLRGNIVNTGNIPTTGRGFQYGLVKIADGAGAAGWSYDAGSFPVGAYSTSTTTLTAGLRIKPNTTYFVRAIAKNAKGTGYGNWVEFKTPAATVPVVTTGPVTRVALNSASFQGVLENTGGLPTTLRGFQYSLTQLPVGAGSAGYTYDIGSYQSGNFFRSTSPLMQGSLPLKPNTVYYVRAIVRNAQGAGYGNWVQFKTLYSWWWPFVL